MSEPDVSIAGDTHFLLFTALVTIGMQLSFFAVAATFKFDKVTDFAGGTNFAVLALLTFFCAGFYTWRQIVVTVAVCLWAVRLSGFLLFRILAIGKDDRFDETREDFCRFLGFWVYQMIWVWAVSLPVTFLNSVPPENQSNDVKASDIIGIAMFAFGLLFEAVADQQKYNFRDNRSNSGKWCDVGLWKYTRHPNYFGEMLLWWGLFVLCSSVFGSAGSDWGIATIVGPIWLSFILLCVSGIPPLEKKSDERYGLREDYREYKRSVPCLIPFPAALFRGLPDVVKTVLCFEWPIYDNLAASSSTGEPEQAYINAPGSSPEGSREV